VVFDEASQLPLEEAVPARFRGEQVIVSGDQMPPRPTSSPPRDRRETTFCW